MTIKTWTGFSKRRNSTKQPADLDATSVTVTLKEGTSIESPTFLLSGDLFSVDYVQAFNNYYFVTDIKSIRNGLTEISCKMDALATFKTDIGNYECLIERSDKFYNPLYPDPVVSILNDIVSDAVEVDPELFSSAGVFALSVLNNEGSGTGFTTTYLLEKSELEKIAQYVNTDWGSAAADILGWLQATFLKTANSIIDCIWLPIKSTLITGPVSLENVKIGVDDVVVGGNNVQGYRLTGPFVLTKQASCTIPHYYSAGDFRRCSPYTVGKIFIPGYGFAEFSPIDFEPTGVMNIYTAVDMSTGDCVVILYNDDGQGVQSFIFNIGASCPVGKVGSDVTNTIGGILSTAANIATARVPGNRYADISRIEAAASSINGITAALGVSASYSGSKGGRAMWVNNDGYVVEIFAHKTQDIDSMETTSGRPDMTERTISTCEGYVKCINASVPIAGMETEREEVNSYLNNGFYYE